MASPRELTQDVLEGASSILLLAPSLGGHDDDACSELLDLSTASAVDLLAATFIKSPEERLNVWRRSNGFDPASVAFVCVGDMTRSVAGQSTDTAPVSEDCVIDTLSSPSDLTGLGILLTERLGELQAGGNRIGICFHSVTALLQYVELRRAFRFLHVLINRVETAGAVIHFHMDPGAHDQRVVSTITNLTEAVVEVDEVGEWTIRTR